MTRTLLLGLDGATYTLLDDLFENGYMPFLKSLIENGVSATLLSTPCPVTPPAWTSMTTGVNPGQHGIFDFISADDSGGTIKFHMETARGVQAETLWSLLNRHGMKAGVMNFPVSYLTPPFDGYMVPGFITARVLKMGVQPREFYDEIKQLPGFDLKAISWNSEGGETTLGSTRMKDLAELNAWVDRLRRKERGWHAIAKALIQKNDCPLLALVFEGVDRIQHLTWDLLDPIYFPAHPTSEDLAARDICYSYYTLVDELLADLVKTAGPDTRIIVASDHGFGSTTELFYANAFLAREGYLTWKPEALTDSAGMMHDVNMRNHFDSIDLPNTVAYVRTASANGIYIRVAREPGQTGIPPQDYERVREEIRQKLLAYRDPRNGEPVVTKVVTRDEAFPGRANHLAPDLTLTLRDGGFVSILNSEELVVPRPEVKGTHRPEGIFVASGPGFRKGARLEDLSILDIAPTLLYSLGLPIPEDLEGRLIEEAFDPAHLQTQPPRKGPPTQPPGAEDHNQAGLEEVDENIVLERLKALGYIE
ncbi:MAG TPA: alkaline phosphatase family protein [Kiritimatiellia bacterium]|nr:alkaline phosphatase family protein [Kiritimatiellia bacterium]